MKIHWDRYADPEEDQDKAPCGTVIGGDYKWSRKWEEVTCQRCLKNREKLQEVYEREEAEIVKQMGEMAEFWRREQQEAAK